MRGNSAGSGGSGLGELTLTKVLILVAIFLGAVYLFYSPSAPSPPITNGEDYVDLRTQGEADKPYQTPFLTKPQKQTPRPVTHTSSSVDEQPAKGLRCKDRRQHWDSEEQRQAFELIVEKYEAEWKRTSDINQHLPFLREVAAQVDTVTEMGTREIVSTWAIIAGRPRSYLGIDPFRSSKIDVIEKAARNAGINFTFWEKSDLEVEIPETEFLFIDTLHTYKQLKQELALHHSKATKYLGFHDTTLFEAKDDHLDKESKDPSGKVGLWPAIADFLEDHPEWRIRVRFTHNNGLTILERIH